MDGTTSRRNAGHTSCKVTRMRLKCGSGVLFPECCVECCGSADTARRHRSVRTGSWMSAVALPLPGPAWWVPYCDACAGRIRRRMFLLRVVGYPTLFVAVGVSILLAQSLPGLRLMWLPVALVLGAGLAFPLLYWAMFWRPPFDAVLNGKTLFASFRSARYAAMFEELNTVGPGDEPLGEPIGEADGGDGGDGAGDPDE